MTMAISNEKLEVFKKSILDMIKVLEDTEDSVLYIKPSEKEWSGMQIVSHVLEAIDYWLVDLEALLIVPGAKWGRNHEHARRLAAVDETVVLGLKKEDTIKVLQNLVPRVEEVLGKVQEEDLAKTAPSYNPNFDGKPLSFIVDHLIVQHVAGHYGQLVRHLQKVQ